MKLDALCQSEEISRADWIEDRVNDEFCERGEYKITTIDTKPEPDPYHLDTGGYSYTALKIYQDGAVEVVQDYNDNATPGDEWHGLTTVLRIPHIVEDTIEDILEDNDTIRRIVIGKEQMWSGSNMVGTMTQDAQDALSELDELLNSGYAPQYEYWSSDDWLGNLDADEMGVTSKMTDEEVAALAKSTVNEALASDDFEHKIIIDEGEMEEYLTGIRQELRDREEYGG